MPLCRALAATRGGIRMSPRIRKVARDAKLCDGGRADFAGVLRSGYLRMERFSPDGQRSIIGLNIPGDLVGDWGGGCSSFTLEAASDAEICCFDPQAVQRMMRGDAAFRVHVLREMADQHARLLELIWRRGALTSVERVIAVIVMATEFMPVERLDDGSLLVRMEISRRDWADLANTTVETICRTLATLSERGMVKSVARGRFRISDVDALMRMGGMDPALDRLLSREAASTPFLADTARGGTRCGSSEPKSTGRRGPAASASLLSTR